MRHRRTRGVCAGAARGVACARSTWGAACSVTRSQNARRIKAGPCAPNAAARRNALCCKGLRDAWQPLRPAVTAWGGAAGSVHCRRARGQRVSRAYRFAEHQRERPAPVKERAVSGLQIPGGARSLPHRRPHCEPRRSRRQRSRRSAAVTRTGSHHAASAMCSHSGTVAPESDEGEWRLTRSPEGSSHSARAPPRSGSRGATR